MKRIVVLVMAVLGLSLVAVPTKAAVNDFTITDYRIEYRLGQDNDKRSTLTTIETITAKFPESDQNHGIERAIPQSYDGHPTSLRIVSVNKPNGAKWDYKTYKSNGNLVVRIGDKDTYVHGEQAFVITYAQRDVTRYFSDTEADEFYWDTNGTEWLVPIEKLSVFLTVEDGLDSKLTGSTACYEGLSGSEATCELPNEGKVFMANATDLAPRENVTIAVGFKPQTFAVYEPTLWDRIVQYYVLSLFLFGAVGAGLIIWFIRRWSSWSNRKRELGTIVPEYIPPKDTSLTAAASLQTNPGSVFTAQLLDFAVRHYLKIYQTKDKSLFHAAEYDIEIVKDISALKAEEQEIIRDIFGADTSVGTRLALSTLKNNTTVYTRTLNNDAQLKKLVRGEYGLRAKNETQTKWFKRAATITFVAAALTLNPVVAVAGIVAIICAFTLWPLTDKGLEVYRYMEGLKMYIKVAETERLKMLQSPEGAEKVGGAVDTSDGGSLVKLYERVLPFAVLFGQEKEWTKRIGELYETLKRSPDWYSGTNPVFNAAAFHAGMSGFSTTSTYSSASSSSSGGSGGGGSSGGGGGGGGGGGW